MTQYEHYQNYKTLPLVDFIVSLGGSEIEIISNPVTCSRFFSVPGTDVTGSISAEVEVLSGDLYVSKITCENRTYYHCHRSCHLSVKSIDFKQIRDYKPLSIVGFIKSLGATKMDLMRNTITKNRYFVIPGADVRGLVDGDIDKLSANLYVSKIVNLKGSHCYILQSITSPRLKPKHSERRAIVHKLKEKSAKIKVKRNCNRCSGRGSLPEFNHVENGICFKCRGARVLTY